VLPYPLKSGTATAIPPAPHIVQISKRSSQSYTGLTAIFTQHSIAYTVQITSRYALPASRWFRNASCEDRILLFIGNVQELIHSLHIADIQLYTLVQIKLLSVANKPFTDCVIQSKTTGSSYNQRT